MNASRFIRNFKLFREALQTQNFTSKELNSLCMQSAIECERLAAQDAQNNLAEEQARAKLELEFLAAQYQLQNQKAQTLNALIQCQSMLQSLKDNAAINRANAYVSWLQVIGNADKQSVINSHFENVANELKKIGVYEDNPTLKECLKNLSKELDKLNQSEGNEEQCQIYASQLETTKGAPIKVWGFSTLRNASECFLINNEKVAEGNCFLFEKQEAGSYLVTFKAVSGNEERSKSLTLKVSEQDLKGLK